MKKKGRDSLHDPMGRAFVYVPAAVLVLYFAVYAITRRVDALSSAVALVAAAVLFAVWWVRSRLARFDAMAQLLEASPHAARAEIDRAIPSQQSARLFDAAFWRVAMVDAWRNGALHRYAALASAAASCEALSSPRFGAARRNALAELAFACALNGDVAASVAAIQAWTQQATDESFDDRGDATVSVAKALVLLREGRIDEAQSTVIGGLSSIARAAQEVREVAFALLAAQPRESAVPEGYRSATAEASSALDESLARSFPAVQFGPIEAHRGAQDERPRLVFDDRASAPRLPAPVRSRVDPISRAAVPGVLGVLLLLASNAASMPALQVASFVMGLFVLVFVLLDERGPDKDRAASKRALAAIRHGAKRDAETKATLERIAASSTATLAGEACLLRSGIATGEGDLGSGLAWAEQCLARLHYATELQRSVLALRIAAVAQASTCLAALGRYEDAERYARLFSVSAPLVRAQLAAIRLIAAARDEDASIAKERARFAAKYAEAAEVRLLADVVLSLGDPAREEACRALLRAWPEGRAWIEAVAPVWSARLIAPVRVSADAASTADFAADERIDEGWDDPARAKRLT